MIHHLPDPGAGLAALAAALKPEGGINLMVYGAIGRTGTYHMQDLARLVTEGVDSRKREARLVIQLIDSLVAWAGRDAAARRLLSRYGEQLGPGRGVWGVKGEDGTGDKDEQTDKETCNPKLESLQQYSTSKYRLTNGKREVEVYDQYCHKQVNMVRSAQMR